MISGRIRHTVAFTLAHPEKSSGERDFLEAADDGDEGMFAVYYANVDEVSVRA